jgi:hypothetical protein
MRKPMDNPSGDSKKFGSGLLLFPKIRTGAIATSSRL